MYKKQNKYDFTNKYHLKITRIDHGPLRHSQSGSNEAEMNRSTFRSGTHFFRTSSIVNLGVTTMELAVPVASLPFSRGLSLE